MQRPPGHVLSLLLVFSPLKALEKKKQKQKKKNVCYIELKCHDIVLMQIWITLQDLILKALDRKFLIKLRFEWTNKSN